jgi:hypothetical protein
MAYSDVFNSIKPDRCLAHPVSPPARPPREVSPYSSGVPGLGLRSGLLELSKGDSLPKAARTSYRVVREGRTELLHRTAPETAFQS